MLAPRSSRRCLLALLVLLILPTLAAQPVMAAKSKPKPAKACKAGQATVKVGKARRCVAPGKAATALERVSAAQMARTIAKAPRRQRRLLSPKAVKRIRSVTARELRRPAVTARAAGLRVAATTAAASGCAGQAERSRTSDPTKKDGYLVTATAEGWGGGSGSSTGLRTTIKAVQGPITATKQETRCLSWDGCPDADGLVHGKYEWSQVETVVASQDGAELRTRSIIQISADLTAHVGDDARVQSYEYVLDGKFEAGGDARYDGKVLKHIPTEIHRIRASRAGLDPHQRDFNGWQKAAYVARGPHGDRIAGSTLQGLTALVGMAEYALQDDGNAALLNSERHFNEDAACLPVTATPGSSKVEPGQRVPVEVTIKDSSGAALALPFQVAAIAGSTDVTSATSKATVNWTAPQERTQTLAGGFAVTHTSKRGVARGSFDPAWADKPPRFALSLEFSSKYSWEYTHDHESNVGTDSECVSHIAGSGYQQLFLDTIAYDEGGTAELVEGFPMFTVKPLTGTMTQQGELKTTRTGPASYCQPASETAPTAGCTSVFSPTTPVYLSWHADGTITLELSNWKAPEFPGDCPLRTPDYGSQPLHPDLDATSTSTTKVSLADLQDPAKKVITVTGGLAGRGHEDCLSEGNGGCGDDPRTSRIRYAIDAWSELEWTLTMKRLTSS